MFQIEQPVDDSAVSGRCEAVEREYVDDRQPLTVDWDLLDQRRWASSYFG